MKFLANFSVGDLYCFVLVFFLTVINNMGLHYESLGDKVAHKCE